MLIAEIVPRWGRTTAVHEKPWQTCRYSVEIAPIFPRSDLNPWLSPFERAVLHTCDIVAQVQQLIQEDLGDLHQPLLVCLQQAQSGVEHQEAEIALSLFQEMLHHLPLSLQPLEDCFHQTVMQREKQPCPGQEQSHNLTITTNLCTASGSENEP